MSRTAACAQSAGSGRIPLCAPEISGNEWAYVKECLDTGWVSSAGEYVDRFEACAAACVGVQSAVSTTSGTAALHIALLVAGIGPGDEVIVPSLTFVACANAVRYVGANIVFVDVDPNCWVLDPDRTASFLSDGCVWENGMLRNRITGRTVKAILPVHLLGHPVDLDTFRDLADQYELILIEDSTESIGAEYKGRKVGCHRDVGCLSFNGNKMITTGGGGMIVTDRIAWSERARYLTQQAKDDPIEYVHSAVGYNYRLSNIQAAMGVAQLERLDSFVEAKKRIADRYRRAFAGLPGVTPQVEKPWATSANWLFTICVNPDLYGETSRESLHRLDRLGIECRPLWRPLPELKPFRECHSLGHEEAMRVYEQGLSLPCSVGLSEVDQDRVIDAVSRVS